MLQRLRAVAIDRPELDGREIPTFAARNDAEAGAAIVRLYRAFATDPSAKVVRVEFADGARYVERAASYRFVPPRTKGVSAGDSRLAGQASGSSDMLQLTCAACGFVNELGYVPTEDDMPMCGNAHREPHRLAL